MSVLITGSSGFVGKNLLSYLREEIITVSRNDLKIIPSSLLNSSETVIHLAGKAHDLKKISSPDDYYYVNYELTKGLYDAFLKSDARKFIFISTVKAVADHLNTELREDIEPNPQTHYGKSKLMAEKYIQSQPLPKGKSFYILRPCMIHGPGNKGNLNLLYSFVSKGVPYPLAAFKNKRSFLSVENLCFIINEIVQREDISTGIYNIADDQAISTSHLVSLISKAIGKKTQLVHIPQSFVMLMAKIGDILHLPLNTERLEKLTENFVVNNEKIKQAIKKELPLSTDNGIINTIRSFNANSKNSSRY